MANKDNKNKGAGSEEDKEPQTPKETQAPEAKAAAALKNGPYKFAGTGISRFSYKGKEYCLEPGETYDELPVDSSLIKDMIGSKVLV